jgi:hypothetical protein
MSNFVPELNSPISTPSQSPTPERNAHGCLTRCPHCGESLSAANSPSSTNATVLSPNSAVPTSPVAAVPAPTKKGLFGLGFLGLGGRRRKTSHRRRRVTRRRRTLNRRR